MSRCPKCENHGSGIERVGQYWNKQLTEKQKQEGVQSVNVCRYKCHECGTLFRSDSDGVKVLKKPSTHPKEKEHKKMSKYYYLNDKGELERAYPLYYRKGRKFERYADYFKVESGGFVTGDRVFNEDGKNQAILGQGDDIDKKNLKELKKEIE